MSRRRKRVTCLIVATYVIDSLLIRTRPWKFFQLNSTVFNHKEGIFSKIEIDKLIPDKWRLPQCYDDGKSVPEQFPVFVKPEWGQNANGIFRANNPAELSRVRQLTQDSGIKYLVQQAATETLEFEIFWILHDQNPDQYADLTITQVINEVETNPVNGVNNPDTVYREISDQFDEHQKQALWDMLGEIGRFGISRVGLRADSIPDLLAGRFHIFEINLFIPMPINILDANYDFFDSWRLIRLYMMSLARITKARNKATEEKPVFTKIMLYNRSSPLLNFIRKRI